MEPHRVLVAMLDLGLVLSRPFGGPYLLADERRRTANFVVDAAVGVLLERGWLTRIDDAPADADELYLLTAEGRRVGARERSRPR
jgi:hypothetical protein